MEIINFLKTFEVQFLILLAAIFIHLFICITQVFKKRKRNSILLLLSLLLVFIFVFTLINLFNTQVTVVKTYPLWQETYNYSKAIEIEFNLPVNLNTLVFNSFPDQSGKITKKTYLPFIPYGRKLQYTPDISYEPGERVMVYLSNIKKPFTKKFGSEYLLEFFAQPLPQVSKSSPTNNEFNVSQNTQISLNLTSENGRFSGWDFEVTPNEPFSVTYPSDKEIRLNFSNTLQSNTTYDIVAYQNSVKYNLSTGEIVSQGDRLPIYNFKFTTAKAPLISLFMPSGENIAPNNPIIIYFDEVMDKQSVESSFKIMPDVTGVFSWDNGKTMRFTPKKILTKNTLYTVALLKGIATLNGGLLEKDTSYTFKTVGEVAVSSTDPENENNNLSINHPISIEFNQEVDRQSAELLFNIEPKIEGGFSWNENALTFTQAVPFEYETEYSITLDQGINSTYGDPSSKKYIFKFKTAIRQYRLDVPYFKQEESFTCNIAGVRMLLAYRGVNFSEKELKDLIGQNESRGNGNPYKGYVVEYGTYWDPISKMVSSYRENKIYKDWKLDDLLSEVEKGNPVLVWGQNGWSDPHELSWTADDGTFIYAINGMHSYVVTGYTGPKDNPTSILVNDPWRGVRSLAPEEFIRLWNYFNTALVIY